MMPGASGPTAVALNALKRFPSAAWRTSSSVPATPAPPATGGSGGRAVGSWHMQALLQLNVFLRSPASPISSGVDRFGLRKVKPWNPASRWSPRNSAACVGGRRPCRGRRIGREAVRDHLGILLIAYQREGGHDRLEDGGRVPTLSLTVTFQDLELVLQVIERHGEEV